MINWKAGPMNPTNDLEALHSRAKALHLYGLLAHWPEATAAGWVRDLIDWEEKERAQRSLERRLAGCGKSLSNRSFLITSKN
jgi:hypothetical protein